MQSVSTVVSVDMAQHNRAGVRPSTNFKPHFTPNTSHRSYLCMASVAATENNCCLPLAGALARSISDQNDILP
jgi:hypothetical protein